MRNKYGNQQVSIGGICFDSKKEARRWTELKLIEKSGLITNLERQVRFVLIPTYKDAKGKVIEREVTYIADFVYYDKELKRVVVEDTKGVRTKEYILKRKLMLYMHGIQIREV